MARPGLEVIRKKELIHATISVIYETGLAEPTLAAISARAGLSSGGMINHYFKNKQDLMESTMRELAGSFLGEVAFNVSSAKTPIDKINAVIDANFASSQCTPEAVTAWLWFWARIPTNTAYADIESATENHVINELKRALEDIVSEHEVDDLAEGIMAIMYGLWLRFAFDSKKINVEVARRITKDLTHSRLRTYI
ncbi:transcriptional regulator BetI [Nitrosomonas sp.]|uniref:transcriptional regulator BetI n=1 Tax=Nitrosomonas sp. TaxID=42353 RepID=UPI00374D370C